MPGRQPVTVRAGGFLAGNERGTAQHILRKNGAFRFA